MEVFRLKRSTSKGKGAPQLQPGNKEGQTHRKHPKLASDSSSCSSVTTEEDLLATKTEWRYSKQVTGTSMKKLLAEEMSREAEPKRRAPSVIARLMGLDGLPPQQSSHKQLKNSSGSHRQQLASIEKLQKKGKLDSRRSSRKNSLEQQEFKDVFEVHETSQLHSSHRIMQGNTRSNLTEGDIAFIWQKFVDAKRLATDEKLQNSREFDDALEVLESNKDLLLEFLQQRDSLFTKHLHDLKGSSPQSQVNHEEALKLLDVCNRKNNGLDSWKLGRPTPCKYSGTPSEQHRCHSSQGHYSHASRPSNIQLSGRDDSAPTPTRIVVLKPNLGRSQLLPNIVSSPCSSHNFLSDSSRYPEISSIKQRDLASYGNKFPKDVGLSKLKPKDSREFAKEITRNMRNNLKNNSMKLPSSETTGYAGDESSCTMSGNESAYESEAMTVSSRESVYLNSRSRPSSSRSTESSVSREAKKRLSEMWTVAHKSQEVVMAGRGSTLGEMLASPDGEVKSEDLKSISEEGFSENFICSNRPVRWIEPLGISSRDGWKDGCISGLPRSRSVPASSSAFGSPKTNLRHRALLNNRCIIPKEVIKRERNKATKDNFELGEASRRRRSKSGRKRSQPSWCPSPENGETSIEIQGSQNKLKSVSKEGHSSDQDIVSIASTNDIADRMSDLETASDIVHENITISPKHPDPELSDDKLESDGCSPTGVRSLDCQEPLNCKSEPGSLPQQPVGEVGSLCNSKEAEQPSPVSILEAPFTDDISSGSECFESLSADLQGLRMQLQLLKMESEACEEGSMLVSSEEDAGEDSVAVPEDKGIPRGAECWESPYLIDVLVDSGFSNADPNTFIALWHSPEHPVDPRRFEELEKKYGNWTSCSRSQRRLLFDRITMELTEIHGEISDPLPWLQRPAALSHKWIKKGIEDKLSELLRCKDNKSKDVLGKVLANDSQWLDLRDDKDAIGREIERLLIDDLVAEMVVM